MDKYTPNVLVFNMSFLVMAGLSGNNWSRVFFTFCHLINSIEALRVIKVLTTGISTTSLILSRFNNWLMRWWNVLYQLSDANMHTFTCKIVYSKHKNDTQAPRQWVLPIHWLQQAHLPYFILPFTENTVNKLNTNVVRPSFSSCRLSPFSAYKLLFVCPSPDPMYEQTCNTTLTHMCYNYSK